MNPLPKIKELPERRQSETSINCDRKAKSSTYDYFNTIIPNTTLVELSKAESDERYKYFLKNGTLHRIEMEGSIIFLEIAQLPKKIVVYRKPIARVKFPDKINLNNYDLPHIPLFEGEDSLRVLNLENNLISKIDHLISLNNLIYLNLYSNKIQEINNLQMVTKLKALMLGKNFISRIQNLNSLNDLEILDLHSNKIKVIENLEGLKKLKLLNLANNQITYFNNLIENYSLEEINLRKNMIVSVPNQLYTLQKLRKINLGKNMISKIENLAELKKTKSLTDIILDDNPILVLSEAMEIIKTLPISYTENINTDNKNNLKTSSSISSTIKLSPKANIRFKINKQKNFSSPNFNLKEKDLTHFNENIQDSESINIINHIKSEWKVEMLFIINHGYNGFVNKRLKETKIYSGHVELEENKRLNIYGNALEVLNDCKEYYEIITTIKFQYFNIDLISEAKNLEKLKMFKNLKNIIFIDNNIHSIYQLIKLEELYSVEAITILNNEITKMELLKKFLIYRFQNLKYFNDNKITLSDVEMSKKMFEYFDNCISQNETLSKGRETNNSEDKKENSTDVEKASPIFSCNKLPLFRDSFENLKRKNELYDFIKANLADVIEELVEENKF